MHTVQKKREKKFMVFIRLLFLSNYVYFEYYPIRSRLSRGFLLVESMLGLLLAVLLALWVTQWSISVVNCELQASKKIHLVEVARAAVDRFSLEKVAGTQGDDLGCQLQVTTWKEPTVPGVTWIGVTASTQGPMGREQVTLVGSRCV